MVRLKNIEKNDTAVWCDIYPENSKEPGFLKVLFSRPDKIETFSLPKGYNRATGILLICYGIIFIILGLPLLSGQNNPYILLSALGVMIETIVIMAVYSLVVEKKYKEQ